MFAALILIAALAADPFQEQVNHQNQVTAEAAVRDKAARRKAELDNSAAPDAETAAKMESRTWRGYWRNVTSDGTLSRSLLKHDVDGKLVRVYRDRNFLSNRAEFRIGTIEVQSSDGTLWRAGMNDIGKASIAYVKAFLADWERKRDNQGSKHVPPPPLPAAWHPLKKEVSP